MQLFLVQSAQLHCRPSLPTLPPGPGIAPDLPSLCLYLLLGGLTATVAADRRRRVEELTEARLDLEILNTTLEAHEQDLERWRAGQGLADDVVMEGSIDP